MGTLLLWPWGLTQDRLQHSQIPWTAGKESVFLGSSPLLWGISVGLCTPLGRGQHAFWARREVCAPSWDHCVPSLGYHVPFQRDHASARDHAC